MSDETNDRVTCKECGAELVMMKRHLREVHDMSTEEYLEKHNLPEDTPMVAQTFKTKSAMMRNSVRSAMLMDAIDAARERLLLQGKQLRGGIIAYALISCIVLIQVYLTIQMIFSEDPFIPGLVSLVLCVAMSTAGLIHVYRGISGNVEDLNETTRFLRKVT